MGKKNNRKLKVSSKILFSSVRLGVGIKFQVLLHFWIYGIFQVIETFTDYFLRFASRFNKLGTLEEKWRQVKDFRN